MIIVDEDEDEFPSTEFEEHNTITDPHPCNFIGGY